MAGIGFVVAVIAANVLLLHAGARPLSPRQTSEAEFTILSPTEIDSYKPYAFYASTGYCSPSATLTWSCGGKRRPISYLYICSDAPLQRIAMLIRLSSQ